MRFERLVDISDVRKFAGFERQIVTHKLVKMASVGLLPEVDLHRSPMVVVQLSLVVRFQPHQYEIPNQIGLGQFPAR